MRGLSALLRVFCVAALSVGLGSVTLAPGTMVTLLLADQGWDLVAKEGLQLGNVPASGLAPLQ